MIPLLLCLSAKGLSLASPLTADLALVYVEHGVRGLHPGVSVSAVRGENIWTFKLGTPHGICHYAVLSLLTSATPKAAQAAGVSLLAERPLIAYGAANFTVSLAHALGDEGVPLSNSALRQCAALQRDGGGELSVSWEKSAVTGEHHTWFRPCEVIAAAPRDRVIELTAMLDRLMHYKSTEAFASGMLLWAASADRRLVLAVCRSTAIWLGPHELGAWIARAKRAVADLKAHHHYSNLPLEQAFELQVLANRGVGLVDWESERAHRVRPALVECPRNHVYTAAMRIFDQGRGRGFEYARESWNSFWQRRWAATPTGSVHSQYEEDRPYISSERIEKTKQFTLTSMPQRGLAHWTGRTPEIAAWKSVKYEWAKNRAIYGTDLTSYVLTDFAMPAVEEALSHVFPVGRKANEKYVSKRIDLAAPGGIALCFDYEDFNSQHSLEAQYEVVQAFRDTYWPAMHRDQREAIEWVLRSTLTQRVTGDGGYRTAGTLLSGWRLTTLVNTVLNRVYLELAGCTALFRDSVHNGDDVLAYTNTVADCVTVLARADQYGIRAQPAKCAIAGLAEFLRVDRAATASTSAQYLTRAAATAVHARAESNVPENAITQTLAQETRIAELQQRGAARVLCENLRAVADRQVCASFNVAHSDLAIMRNTHVVHGGLCEDPDVEPKWRVELEPPRALEKLQRCRALPGVHDYARYLVKAFDLKDDVIHAVREKVARAVASGIELTRRALVVTQLPDVQKAKHEQYLKGVCSADYAVQAYGGRARLTGLPVGRLLMKLDNSMATSRIAKSGDPMRTMAVIF